VLITGSLNVSGAINVGSASFNEPINITTNQSTIVFSGILPTITSTVAGTNGIIHINAPRIGINASYGQTSQTLSVYGTIGNPGAFRLYDLRDTSTAALPTYTFYGDNTTGMFMPGFGSIAFSTTGSERMRLTEAGNILIGTTTDAGYKLDVNGTSRFSNNMLVQGSTILSGSFAAGTGPGGGYYVLSVGNPAGTNHPATNGFGVD
jgi:hypothetical protein